MAAQTSCVQSSHQRTHQRKNAYPQGSNLRHGKPLLPQVFWTPVAIILYHCLGLLLWKGTFKTSGAWKSPHLCSKCNNHIYQPDAEGRVPRLSVYWNISSLPYIWRHQGRLKSVKGNFKTTHNNLTLLKKQIKGTEQNTKLTLWKARTKSGSWSPPKKHQVFI